jgi:hypothetical protein
MNETIQTSDAVKLLRKATAFIINTVISNNWDIIDEDLSHYADDIIIFNIHAYDEDSTTYSFTKQNLLDATVDDNCILIKDVGGDDIIISCYTMKPCFLED